MGYTITCPKCGRQTVLPDSASITYGNCHFCGKPIKIIESSPTSAQSSSTADSDDIRIMFLTVPVTLGCFGGLLLWKPDNAWYWILWVGGIWGLIGSILLFFQWRASR